MRESGQCARPRVAFAGGAPWAAEQPRASNPRRRVHVKRRSVNGCGRRPRDCCLSVVKRAHDGDGVSSQLPRYNVLLVAL